MTMTDPLADMLTRIRNGQRARLAQVSCPASRLRENVLEVLKREGYIVDFAREEKDGKADLHIALKYYDGEPVIQYLRKVSKPGRRVYAGVGELPKVQNGLGISVVSTSSGVMSDYEARVAKVGGEVLCEVA